MPLLPRSMYLYRHPLYLPMPMPNPCFYRQHSVLLNVLKRLCVITGGSDGLAISVAKSATSKIACVATLSTILVYAYFYCLR